MFNMFNGKERVKMEHTGLIRLHRKGSGEPILVQIRNVLYITEGMTFTDPTDGTSIFAVDRDERYPLRVKETINEIEELIDREAIL